MDGPGLERALTGLAVGRIVLGGASRLAPWSLAGRLPVQATPELEYMTRIFGARAVGLGVGYLSTRGRERRRWQRLAFGIDVSDTVHGVALVRRGEAPVGLAIAFTALTGAYALIGGAKVVRDLTAGR